MQKPQIKKVHTDMSTGEITGHITNNYKLHWASDFMKVGQEYVHKMSSVTPKARNIFDVITKDHMDAHNKLVNKQGLPLTKIDIQNIFNLTPRRVDEILKELISSGILGKFETQDMKCFVVNPTIVSKSQYTNYAILNLFANYKLISTGTYIYQEYDLGINSTLNYMKDMEE